MAGSARSHSKAVSLALAGVGTLALLAGMLAVPAAAAPSAIVDLAGCKTNTLPANDDASTAAVPLGFPANFAGTIYTEVYVNNNGNVTLGQPFGEFFDFDYWVPERAIVAPFHADVDTRGAGSSAVTYGQTTFDGQPAFCVNWVDVGYFDGHSDKLNSFQLLLVQRGTAGAFDIVFNYDQVQWETGDDVPTGSENGFGGISASWGYANGDGERLFAGAGSFVNGALVDGGTAALTANSYGSSQPGRYVYPINPPTGTTLSGQVTEDGVPVAFSPVEICPAEAGSCITRSTNAAGQYRAYGLTGSYYLTAFPPATSERNRGHAGPVTIESADVTQDIALGTSPLPPPAGTSITSYYTTDAGVPVAFWDSTLTLTTHGCPGGWALAHQRTSRGQFEGAGQMTEGPPGTYTSSLVPARHGNTLLVQISVNCPSPVDNTQVEFDLYAVPSGRVLDHTSGGMPDADVVLLRASSPTDPFVPVLPGSALLSPSNRFNPDVTVPDGRFGWDVPAGGYYKIQASRPGCVSDADRTSTVAESDVLTMQPPSTSLYLRLYCPPPTDPPPTEPPPTEPPPTEPSPATTPPPPPATTAPPPAASPPAPVPSAVADTTVPHLSGLAVSPRSFQAVLTPKEGGTKASNARRGSKITFRLSEQGNVAFTVARKTQGRMVGGVCKAQTAMNTSHEPCTRWVGAGTFSAGNLAAGQQKVAFTGRIRAKALKVGTYRLAAVPTDAAGNRGTRRTALFKILRG